jgi:hypothetical protein
VNENDHKRWMNVHHMQAPCPSKILNLEKWIVTIVMATKEVGEEMSEWMKIWSSEIFLCMVLLKT